MDPVYTGGRKVCSFDCTYCQAGRTRSLLGKRKIFIPTKNILDEIKSLPPLKIDYVTFSGAGEPTLAKNLGSIIKGIKKIGGKKIAVLTNSTLIYKKSVQKSLMAADAVIAKLDAPTRMLFGKINKPARKIKFEKTLKGLKAFRKRFKNGKFILQIMFVPQNKGHAEEIARLAREINPDQVQINTPLRHSRVGALSKNEIKKIKMFFKNINTITVYDRKLKKVKAMDKIGIAKRRSGR